MKKMHSKGRPPPDAREVMALNDRGRWINDDGERHRAFSFITETCTPIAMWCGCDCSMLDTDCPGTRAMDKTSARWRCANGRRFGFKP